MFRSPCTIFLGRSSKRKIWSPLGARSTSTPRQVISGNEMATIFYRKLPPECTVEAEEDFGHNLLLHREFVSKKASTEGMPWDVNPMARSKVEQRFAKATIARGVNQARRAVAVNRAEGDNHIPVLNVSNSIQGTPGSIEAVRYVFDDKRMKYCERFERIYGTKDVDVEEEGSGAVGQINLAELKALLETAAILYGCESDEAREAWYQFFLGLDRASLEELEERRMNLSADADDEEEIDNENKNQLVVSESNSKNQNNKKKSPTVPAEFAEIYSSYKAYCEGKSPTFGNAQLVEHNADITEQSILRKFRYRKLLELLVAEEPLTKFPPPDVDEISGKDKEYLLGLTNEEFAQHVAAELDGQLQTLKLYGLRVGEAVKESVMLQERSAGSGVALDSKPQNISAYNPYDTR